MQPFMFDHIQSVEHLSDGRVRIIAVLPFESFENILVLAEHIIHASRFLNTRSRVARAMYSSKHFNLINEGLADAR